jgi:DNA (cytosine-5)-methyltransferase 1
MRRNRPRSNKSNHPGQMTHHNENKSQRYRRPIPVVDVFAGPGGLGEGFSSLIYADGTRAFRLALSIEKDPVAHRTLSLRAAFRLLGSSSARDTYYEYAKGLIDRPTLDRNPGFAEAFRHASAEARCEELGPDTHASTDAWIEEALAGQQDWVLIGGPPCQAYSLAGRSRLRSKDVEKFERDKRHFLYKEYLRIIEKFRPAIFVMENVKGMLSSTNGGEGIFERIVEDLSRPALGVEYRIHSLVEDADKGSISKRDFVIRSENYGVPQARHRVILLGVRTDFARAKPGVLKPVAKPITVRDVIARLPKIRSRLSKEDDSPDAWLGVLSQLSIRAAKRSSTPDRLVTSIEKAVESAARRRTTGEQFISGNFPAAAESGLRDWFHDPDLGGVIHHTARSHMRSDLHRYLYLSAHVQELQHSLNLKTLPRFLVPDHSNAKDEDAPFLDRFRVQRWDRPSTTVVSHIAKDGHYYIHPDPSQCRSLTVREAARLQTFPDNYFFEGNRTQQYHQVGNAVPPWLARQIGQIVLKLYEDCAHRD